MSANYRYDWGQAVCVTMTAPDNMRPGEGGSVCGMRETDDDRLYLVEFSDGKALEIPEKFIEAMKDE